MIETRGRHPGVTLHEDFIKPLGMSDRLFSAKSGIPLRLVALLRVGHTPITVKLAEAIAKFFPETNESDWIDAQDRWKRGVA